MSCNKRCSSMMAFIADDNAQSMFVLPYLKDKVKTPVMFCAVEEIVSSR